VARRPSPLLLAIGLLLAWPFLGPGSARAATLSLVAVDTSPSLAQPDTVGVGVDLGSESDPGLQPGTDLPPLHNPLLSDPGSPYQSSSNGGGAGGTGGHGGGTSGAPQTGALSSSVLILVPPPAYFAPKEGRCDLPSLSERMFHPPRAAL
jgi:hypothetical protein